MSAPLHYIVFQSFVPWKDICIITIVNDYFRITTVHNYQIWHIRLYWTRTIYMYFPCIREIWRFVHPRKLRLPSGNMTILKVNKSSYLPYAKEMNVLFHQANVLVNSAKSNLLAIFVYKIIILEHLWSYLY